jgi:hypothetical protein
MDTIIIVIGVIGVIVITFFITQFNTYEHFTNTIVVKYRDTHKNKRVKNLKKDIYMDFLGDLNDSFKKHLDKHTDANNIGPIKQKTLCDDKVKIEIQSAAVNDAFNKIPSDIDIFKSPVFDKKPSDLDFIDSSKNECLYKAQHISEYTNPMFYLSESIYFPPLWIGPYKDTPLPKHTNLKQWSNMHNCCKNNF